MTTEEIRAAVRAGVLRYAQAKYAALESSRKGVRPLPQTERGPEEARQFTDRDRLLAIAINRNLLRSNSKALAIVGNRTVLGFGVCKARFASENEEWNRKATEYFNVDFARDARWDEPEHFTEIIQGIERALMTEGDVLVAMDDGWLGDTGKLLIWEADQLCEVSESDWRLGAPDWARGEDGKPFPQAHGVIIDPAGRTAGYIVCRRQLADEKAGALILPMAEVTCLRAEDARLCKNRFRFNSRRGVPSMLAVSDNLYDIDEMVKSELSSARLKAKMYAYVKHSEKEPLNTEQQQLASSLFEQLTAAETTGAPVVPGQPSDPSDPSDQSDKAAPATVELPRYEHLEAAVGGMTDYMAPGDSVEWPDVDRPNVDVATFFNELGDAAGASQGLTQGFTRMAVSSSYTAHRGETVLTYAHLRNYRKRMEHQLLDWIGERVIRRAVRKGLVPAPTDPRWMFRISWEFPAQDSIDPERQAKADFQRLKNGETTFAELLGPDWRGKFRELSAELAEAKALWLPLDIFDTVAGAPARTNATTNTEE